MSSSAAHTFDLSPQYYSRIHFSLSLLKHGGDSFEGKERESDGHSNKKINGIEEDEVVVTFLVILSKRKLSHKR